MNYELSGTLYQKFPLIQRSATFKVREFIVENVKEVNGKAIVNYIKFQSTQDKTDLIEKFNEGDKIKVYFNIRGSKWEKNGQVSYFNNLEAWRVEYSSEISSGNQASSDETTPITPNNHQTDNNDDLPF